MHVLDLLQELESTEGTLLPESCVRPRQVLGISVTPDSVSREVRGGTPSSPRTGPISESTGVVLSDNIGSE